jgi:type IX secretion system PorP/SprF family membrane protein
MRNSIIGIAVFLLALSARVDAQFDPVYSQYMYDKMLVNPAYAGSSHWIVTSLKYRKHLQGIDGAPQTSVFSFHTPLQKKSMGLGFQAAYDQIGVSNTMSVGGIYAFHLGFGQGKLSFGLEGGLVRWEVDYNSLHRNDPDDIAIPTTAETRMLPDASVGIYYHSKNFYLGASARHLFEGIDPAFYGFGAYIIDLGDHFYAEPGLMVRYVPGAPVQPDFFVNLNYRERITIGVANQDWDVISFMMKLDLGMGLRMAYSYDLNLSGLSNYTSGSHEIMLSYGIRLLPPPARKEVHPRYYF